MLIIKLTEKVKICLLDMKTRHSAALPGSSEKNTNTKLALPGSGCPLTPVEEVAVPPFFYFNLIKETHFSMILGHFRTFLIPL